MWQPGKTTILFAPDGVGAGDAGAGAAAGSAAPAAAAGAAGAAGAAASSTPWHQGIPDEVRGWGQNKGWLVDDPKEAFSKAVNAHREAQRFIGAPPEQLLRIPQPNAESSEVTQFLERIGVPKESKDYDLSGVKFSDGAELDPAFVDMIRGSMHRNRVPKDYASNVVKDIVKFMEDGDKADLADRTAAIQEQTAALDRDWGTQKAAYLVVAKSAMDALGKAANLTPDQIKAGWDAISEVGGIGSSYAMKMLFEAGRRMGEAPFITGGQGGGGPGLLSRDAARAEIEALKTDKEFGKRLIAGGRDERKRWDDLHAVAFPRGAAA